MHLAESYVVLLIGPITSAIFQPVAVLLSPTRIEGFMGKPPPTTLTVSAAPRRRTGLNVKVGLFIVAFAIL
jgi:hypothetical protein